MTIHSTAIISEGAKIHSSVEIGPYCVIGPKVELKKGVKLYSHVCLEGETIIGENTTIFPFASIGHVTQDKKYKGEKSLIYIGKNNTIREYVTIHGGTDVGGNETIIGDNGLFMINVHIAHDCKVGNNVVMSNNATLAGHVTVGDFANLGGLSAVHQFCRIGAHSIIGGGSIVVEDVVPYGNIMGERAHLAGLNLIGLKRRGFERDEINTLRNSFKRLFFENETTLEERIEEVASEFANNDSVMEIINFLKHDTKRSICMPKDKVVI